MGNRGKKKIRQIETNRMAYLNLIASIIKCTESNTTIKRDYENGLKRHSLSRQTTDSLKGKKL